MRIALGQIDMGFEEKEKAMTLCSRLLAEAKEKQVDFVIFPEMTLAGFTLNPETYGEDRKNSPSMAFFREEAKKNHVAICYGLPVYENGIATNHCIILDENGNQLADYAKIHPFSFGAEAKHYTGGNALQLCEVKGVPVAPLICYDLRFPEIFQIVSEQAKVIPVIASWPTARREHWMTLLKARAIENQCFILGVNRSGEGGGLSYIGDSMAVSPTGEVLAHVEGGNGLTIVDIDLSEADAYRNSFPVKADRKPALYHTLWEENIKQK
ncbi:nitrilase-related carbon-nitrogen hydrolase [Anaerotignum faecicola]